MNVSKSHQIDTLGRRIHFSITVCGNSRIFVWCTDTFTFSQMAQNEFLFCKAAEGGDAVASLTDNNAADGNSGESFGEM